MRRIGAFFGLVFLVASTSQVLAAVVHVSVAEPSDAPPSVTSDIVGFESSSDFEVATLVAHVDVAGTNGLPVGTTSVILDEPSNDPFNQPTSDLIILTIGQQVTNGTTSQQINLQFFSDSFQGFDRLVAANPNAVHVTETGSLQDITEALGLPVNSDHIGTILQVQASSDLNTPEIPEPGSLALFGIGVAGILGYKSQKTKSAA
jgi:hypothetical protein